LLVGEIVPFLLSGKSVSILGGTVGSPLPPPLHP